MEAFYSKKIEGLNYYIISTDTSRMDDGVSPRSYMIKKENYKPDSNARKIH